MDMRLLGIILSGRPTVDGRTRMEKEHKSAAQLLAEWRAAGRDVTAAMAASHVAELALAAAEAAEEAATAVQRAADAALSAVEHARDAAGGAQRAATLAAEAAQLASASAEGDKARAEVVVTQAQAAEAEAGERFHDAEEHGFPRNEEPER
jgi:hypothetical protein